MRRLARSIAVPYDATMNRGRRVWGCDATRFKMIRALAYAIVSILALASLARAQRSARRA